jgi:hypothetical protein
VILNVGTTVSNYQDEHRRDYNSLLLDLPFMKSLSEKNIKSDGLVPLESAILDCSIEHIVLDGLDHIDPVSSNFRMVKKKDYDRVASFKAFLAIILEMIEDKQL